MGRPKLFHERMLATFPDGTFALIDKALWDGEDRTTFVRRSVAKEMARRGLKKAARELFKREAIPAA